MLERDFGPIVVILTKKCGDLVTTLISSNTGYIGACLILIITSLWFLKEKNYEALVAFLGSFVALVLLFKLGSLSDNTLSIILVLLSISGLIIVVKHQEQGISFPSKTIKLMRKNKSVIIITILVLMLFAILRFVQVPTATVDSKKEWQSTMIQVGQNSTVSIEVIKGKWTTDKNKRTPNYNNGGGDNWKCVDYSLYDQCVEPMPEEIKGSLIGKIGDQEFAIGSKNTIIAKQSGQLELRINDVGIDDNEGVLTVKVTIKKR